MNNTDTKYPIETEIRWIGKIKYGPKQEERIFHFQSISRLLGLEKGIIED